MGRRVQLGKFRVSWAPAPGRVRTCSPSDCHGGLLPHSLELRRQTLNNNRLGVRILHHVSAESVLLFYDDEVGPLAKYGRFMIRYLIKIKVAFRTIQHAYHSAHNLLSMPC